MNPIRRAGAGYLVKPSHARNRRTGITSEPNKIACFEMFHVSMLNVSLLTWLSKRMPTLLSVPQLASRIAQSKQHVWRLCREGQIPHTRINGKTIRFDSDEIDAWITSGRQPLKNKEAQ